MDCALEWLNLSVKMILVLATVGVSLYPIPWLSRALNDPQVKIGIVFAILLITVWDPILALLMVLFFIAIEINGSDSAHKSIGALHGPDQLLHSQYPDRQPETPYKVVADKEKNPKREKIQAPSCLRGIPGTTIGYPTYPPLGWNPDPAAPPTGEQVQQLFHGSTIEGMDHEIQALCAIPDSRLAEIQSNELSTDLNRDEDTGMARIDANTLLL